MCLKLSWLDLPPLSFSFFLFHLILRKISTIFIIYFYIWIENISSIRLALIYILTSSEKKTSLEVFVVCVIDDSCLTGVKWKLNVFLISISFLVKDAENFFIYLLVICTSSFENSPFSSFVCLFSGLLTPREVSFFELPVYSSF
jgi:hypothetical protein